MEKNYNTYLSVTLYVYPDCPDRNGGRIYTSVEDAKLDLHLDVTYRQAKKELAKLMLRTGKLPHVRYYDDSAFYTLDGFLT